LETEIHALPPSRLLSLIGQALIWQKEKGLVSEHTGSYDLLRSEMKKAFILEAGLIPSALVKTIKYSKETLVECAQFSPDGRSIAVGTADGFVEMWDLEGRLEESPNSTGEPSMSMESSVTCLAFNRQGTLLVTGSALGAVSVWNLASGRCVRSFKDSFSKETKSISVTSVSFFKDDSQILSSSLDGIIR
jgi:WD40 repeat-containing protein SMU1